MGKTLKQDSLFENWRFPFLIIANCTRVFYPCLLYLYPLVSPFGCVSRILSANHHKSREADLLTPPHSVKLSPIRGKNRFECGGDWLSVFPPLQPAQPKKKKGKKKNCKEKKFNNRGLSHTSEHVQLSLSCLYLSIHPIPARQNKSLELQNTGYLESRYILLSSYLQELAG
jgi:hypothetical protein